MWSIVWYIVTFIGGAFICLVGLSLCSVSGKESNAEEERAAERLSLRGYEARRAKEEIERLEEKYQVSFSSFEERIAPDEKLKDYAEWAFWLRTLEKAEHDIAQYGEAFLQQSETELRSATD